MIVVYMYFIYLFLSAGGIKEIEEGNDYIK